MTLVDEGGRPVNIGPPVTTPGGEAVVHQVLGNPDMVAKIYHVQPTLHKLAKLEHLRKIATPKLLRTCAWPSSLLFEPKGGRPVRGFMMPLVKGKEIHRLYGPHDRMLVFPDARWDFLLQVAKNSAAAFEALHEHEVIMADVNEKNLLVSANGLVHLIDCDSYQVAAEDRYFLCDVGVPLWTPPELQGKDFRGLVRTKNHDRFGLAVLIFQLLFMGRHPFAGVRETRRDYVFEESIADFLFAFSSKNKGLGIRPPPHTLPLEAVPENLTRLFERAFLRGSEKDGARPTGAEWHRALEFVQQNTVACGRDPAHIYYTRLAKCPWCEISENGGPNFFPSEHSPTETTASRETITAYWIAIEKVTRRNFRTPTLADFPIAQSVPSGLGRHKTGPGYEIGWVVFAGSIPLYALGMWFGIGAGLVGLALIIMYSRDVKYRAEYRLRRRAIENAKRDVEASLAEARQIIEDYGAQFKKRKLKLQGAHLRFLQLDDEHRRDAAKLEAKRRELQLNEYLNAILLRDHRIPEIGPPMIRTLQAFGIESAFDISTLPFMTVPGIDKHLQSVLESWRQQWVSRFNFDPTRPIPAKDLHDLELRAADLSRALENELKGGVAGLNELGAIAQDKLHEHNRRTDALVERLAAAQVHLRELG